MAATRTNLGTDLGCVSKNGKETQLPDVPVHIQILSGAQTAQALVPAGKYIALPSNKVIQLSFTGGSPAPTTHHPMYLHGYAFSVIRAEGQETCSFQNPPWRDMVSVGAPGDNVTIRFRMDNTGTSSVRPGSDRAL
jgi:iron transport multicopper oxidase